MTINVMPIRIVGNSIRRGKSEVIQERDFCFVLWNGWSSRNGEIVRGDEEGIGE